MITLIAALYVVLPALFALACVTLAWIDERYHRWYVVAESEYAPPSARKEASRIVFAVARDASARKAIDALHVAQTQECDSARRIWLDVALVYKLRAERYQAALRGVA